MPLFGRKQNMPLEGTFPVQAYIYDARPLSRIPNGTRFWLDASTAPITLTSRTTGTRTRIGEGNFALTYKGKLVGMSASAFAAPVHQLIAKGYTVQVLAEQRGTVDGSPDVKLLLPSYKHLCKQVDAMP